MYKAAVIEKMRGLCIMGSDSLNWGWFNQYVILTNACKTPWGSKNCISLKQEQSMKYKQIAQKSGPSNLAKLVSPKRNIQHIDDPDVYGGDLCDDIIDYLYRNEGVNDTNILKYWTQPYKMYTEPTVYLKGDGLIKQSELLRI